MAEIAQASASTAEARPATPGGITSHTSPAQAQQFLYEGRYGLPVVREYLQYHELLKAIRLEEVQEIFYFTQENAITPQPEGPCIVHYRCGSEL